MTRAILLASAALFASAPALAGHHEAKEKAEAAEAVESAGFAIPSGTYALDKTHASLTWKVSHLGLSDYTARFTDFDANVELNAEDPAQSTLSVTINPASVETDYPGEEDFDAKLRSEEWFNTENFPAITFTSTGIEVLEGDKAKISGDLTFLGETLPVTLKAKLRGQYEQHPFISVPAFGISAKTKIKRSDFGMTTYVPPEGSTMGIGDDVAVYIEAEFVGAAPAADAE